MDTARTHTPRGRRSGKLLKTRNGDEDGDRQESVGLGVRVRGPRRSGVCTVREHGAEQSNG